MSAEGSYLPPHVRLRCPVCRMRLALALGAVVSLTVLLLADGTPRVVACGSLFVVAVMALLTVDDA